MGLRFIDDEREDRGLSWLELAHLLEAHAMLREIVHHAFVDSQDGDRDCLGLKPGVLRRCL